ncbi:prepilin peptidase [Citricoccus sp. GCM10030269]|uniref:prepilin peptidase n=1 Tax=Citricoccus sp. GCM10030269 TaxID=3273388 RepID=UPI0036147596
MGNLGIFLVTALAGLTALAGALVGHWGWRLAARGARGNGGKGTALPGRWRPWLALATGVVWAAVVLLTRPAWFWPAALWLGAGVVLLGAVDLRSRLLPNRLVGPFAIVAAATLGVAALGVGEPIRLLGAGAGGVALFAIYLVLALISPGSLGMGDVKLAAVLGAYGGWLGWIAWWWTALGGFLLGGMTALVLVVIRRSGRRDRFAFGPAMLLGALAVVLAATWGGA